MSISVGDRLPEASLLRVAGADVEVVPLQDRLAGRRVILVGLPGAFTNTCSSAHVPSFIRTREALREKGVDEIICVAVNDPFVMHAWGEATGAAEAGLTMLADAEGAFTRAIGMEFSNPARGLIGRSLRYALLAEDGVVKVYRAEEGHGVCDLSGGEAMLAEL
jgi:glutaredoxin/glutathione-dependent peroxiredoxin